jgi:hypothetical protein
MSERALAKKVIKILAPLDAHRVENPCHPGTPDVEFIGGQLELKQQDEWPKRATTKIKLKHDLSVAQRVWLCRRIRKGGRAFVLVQISKDYLLLSGGVASKILGEVNREELCKAALFVVNAKELPEALLYACDNRPN